MRALERLRTFALVRTADDVESAVGFGFVLPDGSAVSVSWPARAGCWYCSTSDAEENAFLCDADLVWLDEAGVPAADYDHGTSVAQSTESDTGQAVNLIGVAELCDLFWKIYRDRFLEVTFRGDFPKPAAELAGGEVWIREEVEEFLDAHGDVLAALFGPRSAGREA